MTELQIHPTATAAPSEFGDTLPAAGRRDWQRMSLFAGGIMFAIGNLLHETLSAMNPQWPVADFDVEEQKQRLIHETPIS